MGGTVASSLAMETIPDLAWPDVGHFQAGYPASCLFASGYFGLFYGMCELARQFHGGALPVVFTAYLV